MTSFILKSQIIFTAILTIIDLRRKHLIRSICMRNTFKSRLQKIEKLPPLPEIAHQILNLTNDHLLSVDELKNIVERDRDICKNTYKAYPII
jgi:hypothetical protein